MNKLLFITAFPPNNKSGGQVFSLNLLKDLSKKYKVDLIYFNYEDHTIDKNISVNSIKSFNVSNLYSLRNFTKHPVFTRRFNKNILHYIANIASNYDILFFDYTQVGIYSLFLKHPYKVIRCHDVMAQKFTRRNKFFYNWVKLTENKILESAKKCFVLTEKDAEIIKKEYNLKVQYANEYLKNFQFYNYSETGKIFVFFGLWSRPENTEGLLWFVKKVIPLINQNTETTFLIIGGGLSDKIVKKYLSPYKNIRYLDFVDDPLDIIYKSGALVAPLFSGAGVKVKVIDAFTTGTPVIGTDITFEGLPYIKNLVRLAKEPSEYADIINNFTALSSNEKKENAAIFRSIYDKNHLSDYL